MDILKKERMADLELRISGFRFFMKYAKEFSDREIHPIHHSIREIYNAMKVDRMLYHCALDHSDLDEIQCESQNTPWRFQQGRFWIEEGGALRPPPNKLVLSIEQEPLLALIENFLFDDFLLAISCEESDFNGLVQAYNNKDTPADDFKDEVLEYSEALMYSEDNGMVMIVEANQTELLDTIEKVVGKLNREFAKIPWVKSNKFEWSEEEECMQLKEGAEGEGSAEEAAAE
jgi:hypothetical protein